MLIYLFIYLFAFVPLCLLSSIYFNPHSAALGQSRLRSFLLSQGSISGVRHKILKYFVLIRSCLNVPENCVRIKKHAVTEINVK